MPTVCIQCALEAFVNARGDLVPGDSAWATRGVFDEEPAAHMARVHPHGVDPKIRQDLEKKAAALIAAKGDQ